MRYSEFIQDWYASFTILPDYWVKPRWEIHIVQNCSLLAVGTLGTLYRSSLIIERFVRLYASRSQVAI